MGRRLGSKASEIKYPSRVEGWLDVCEVEGQPSPNAKQNPWSEFYCVLQQDELTFTAYCSEELSLTDSLFTELPRVRLDCYRRQRAKKWQAPPTLEEEPEEEEEGEGSDDFADDYRVANTTLEDLGESLKARTLPRIHFHNNAADNEKNNQVKHSNENEEGNVSNERR